MSSFVNDYIDEAMDWELCDIFECDFGLIPKRPLYEHFLKYIIGIDICMPWGAPIDGDCESCNEDAVKPCSEYRCKSISTRCNYFENVNTGIGECKTLTPERGDLEIRFVRPPDGYRFENDYFNWKGKIIEGKKLAPKVGINSEITFEIETSKEASCWIAPLPEGLDTFIGGTTFSKRHNITIFIPEVEIYIRKIQSLLNIGSFSGLITNPDDMPASDYTTFFEIVNDAFPGQAGEIMELVPSLKKILIDADLNIFHTFIKCMDTFGNMNKEDTFVSVKVSEDEEAPMVRLISPGDGDIATAGAVAFKYRASDNEVLKMLCSLWYSSLDRSWHNEGSRLTLYNLDTTIELPLTANTYTWSISCSDGFNTAFAGNRTLTVT